MQIAYNRRIHLPDSGFREKLSDRHFCGGFCMRTVVAKFGGTSLADAEHFQAVREIIREDPDRRFIVVSAPGKRWADDIKVTDLLETACDQALRGADYEFTLQAVQMRYADILTGLGLESRFDLLGEISRIRLALQHSPSHDYIVSRGEYLSARILALYLGYTFVDPEWCVSFDTQGKLDSAITARTLAAALRPLSCAVIAGFYGSDMAGQIHTFSRGGSDITGSLVAAAMQADLYENWTDVSGLLAADPRIVPAPRTVRYMSYRELRTLSYMGASVLHTDAVLPVSDTDIPINIRNTDHPEEPGTTIVRKLPKGAVKDPIIGVAGRTGMSVIQIEKVMVSDESGFSAVILDLLRQRQLPFEQCLTGIDTVTLVIRSDLLDPCKEELFHEIRERLHPDYLGLKEHLSMIAVIGEMGTEISDANIRVLDALIAAGIPISTINQGAGKLNLLIGVSEDKYIEAIQAVYGTIGSPHPAHQGPEGFNSI